MSIVGRLSRSLVARMLCVFLITAIALFMVISVAFSYGMKHQFESRIRPHLRMYMTYITHDIGSPPDIVRAEKIARRLPMNIVIQGPDLNFTTNEKLLEDIDDFEVYRRDGKKKRAPENTSPRRGRGLPFEVGEADDRTISRTTVGEYTYYYALRHRDHRERRADPERRGRFRDHPPVAGRVFFVTLLLVSLILAACLWAIHRLLRPVRQIQSGVARMGDGELDYRINIKRRDDLGELAGSIDNMAGDIEQMLDAKRQLLLAISHELRSPITRAKISTELLDASDARDRISDDLKEMESLVTELLESERLNTRHSVITPGRVDVGELIRSVVSEAFDGEVDLDVPSATTLRLDETRVRLLLRNLIGNAVRHGRDGSSKPKVTARVESNTLSIDVSDSGAGIAPEHIEHLTDPFYRADPSRTRATGGFGLGLYLARLIAEAHGGRLEITSVVGEGTTVRAVLSDQPATEA